MQIILNGHPERLEHEMLLSDFLVNKGLNPDTIIVQYNEKILKKHAWVDVTLQEADCLEVLNFVGGG